MAGHTAGKSSFCRLLRYALGEPQFADPESRERIRDQLPEAWLLAETMIADRSWAVARPIGPVAKSFCLSGATADELMSSGEAGRTDFDEYIAALDDVLGSPRLRDKPDQEICWRDVLPWLTRDQECRFSDFREWRDSSSASEAPRSSTSERQLLMRTVLGLMHADELGARAQHAALLEEQRRLRAATPLARHQRELDQGRLQSALGELVHVDSDLAAGALLQYRDSLRASAAARRGELEQQDERDSVEKEKDLALITSDHAAHDEREAERLVDQLTAELRTLGQETSGAKSRVMLGNLLRSSGKLCGVPMVIARQRGCPVALAGEEALAAPAVVASLEARRSQLEEAIREAKEHHAMVLLRRQQAEQRLQERNHALIRARADFDRRREECEREDRHIDELERIMDWAESSRRGLQESENAEKRLSAKVKASSDALDAVQAATKDAVADFSCHFERAAQALLGTGIEARVDSHAQGFGLHIARSGERNSAALTTAKLLAFDLAALTVGLAGQGHFPGFLVHDGPREADLAPDIYSRLFRFVRGLEDLFTGEPGFQYIVTTTTDPPLDVQREPWLRLTLSGADPEQRLYRRDL
jgi:hypothetical protein